MQTIEDKIDSVRTIGESAVVRDEINHMAMTGAITMSRRHDLIIKLCHQTDNFSSEDWGAVYDEDIACPSPPCDSD